MMSYKGKFSALGLCLAATLACANVNAATTATMTVSGSFIPAACNAELSNSGAVDYGTMNHSMLETASSGNTLVQLNHKKITLTVNCDAATTIGVIAQDNRSASKVALSSTTFIDDYIGKSDLSTTGAVFGLGTVGSAKIGAYALTAVPEDSSADGEAVSIIIKDTDSGNVWKSADAGGLFYPDGTRIVTVAEKGKIAPLAFTEMVMPLEIAPAVQTKGVLGASSEVVLDGNATLSLVYL
ncbi:DUF1120 domain-containing protein [Enterobacteriaceae bacterium H4N4]|uniref:DUF1120 domain-containing protein n=1 Tax=Silvania confinis TaxID=2926470 RepID=A0A9J6QFV4_9ENTR|nr:DUF1120 domain-containing protein [Silvania confinis]MCU6669793.1 DUF1120 domain-containing protein [Silvania confinis]